MMCNQPVFPPPGGLREAVLITEELLQALIHAKQIYLVPWREQEAPHRLIITALPTLENRATPANYGQCRATLIIPPALRHLFQVEEPSNQPHEPHAQR